MSSLPSNSQDVVKKNNDFSVVWSKFLVLIGLLLIATGVVGLSLISSEVSDIFFSAHIVIGSISVVIWFFVIGIHGLGGPSGVLSARVLKFSFTSTIASLSFLLLIISLNWYANKYNKIYDATEQGVYSLSPQSKNLLKSLKYDLKLIYFKVANSPLEETDLLQRYQEINPQKISVVVHNAEANPALVKKYEMKPNDKLYLQYGTNENEKSNTRLENVSEEAITNSLLKLSRGVAKKVYFVSGHGEPQIDDEKENGLKSLSQALVDENFKVESFLLPQEGKVPDDAAALVLISPSLAWQDFEINALIDYVKKGGSLLIAEDPLVETIGDIVLNDNFNLISYGAYATRKIAKEFGINYNDDIILDIVNRLFAGPALGTEPTVRTYDSSHDSVKGFTDQDLTIFSLASSLSFDQNENNKEEIDSNPNSSQNKDEKTKYHSILKTSSTAWGEMNITDLLNPENPKAEFNQDDDNKAPLNIAVSYAKEVDNNTELGLKKTSRLIVFGDSNWLRNKKIGLLSNRNLATQIISWLAGEEGGYSIPQRSLKASVAFLSMSSLNTILILTFMIPELILIMGLAMWWRRKSA